MLYMLHMARAQIAPAGGRRHARHLLMPGIQKAAATAQVQD